jgi:hypothetical protein
MDTTDTSENYRRGNLLVGIFFARFPDRRNILEVTTKSEVMAFLDIRKKETNSYPDRR